MRRTFDFLNVLPRHQALSPQQDHSGTIGVDAHGYTEFFVGTAMLGVPVLILVALVARLPMTMHQRP